MDDGYYWYFSGDGDEGDLESDEPQIVEILRGGLIVMGTDYPYEMSDAHGTFKGPLVPPEI